MSDPRRPGTNIASARMPAPRPMVEAGWSVGCRPVSGEGGSGLRHQGLDHAQGTHSALPADRQRRLAAGPCPSGEPASAPKSRPGLRAAPRAPPHRRRRPASGRSAAPPGPAGDRRRGGGPWRHRRSARNSPPHPRRPVICRRSVCRPGCRHGGRGLQRHGEQTRSPSACSRTASRLVDNILKRRKVLETLKIFRDAVRAGGRWAALSRRLRPGPESHSGTAVSGRCGGAG